MIQDIAVDDWMLRSDLTRAIKALIEADLTFDALVLPQHLSRLKKLMTRHPDLRVVIDHGAKPDISGRSFDDWAHDIAAIARNTDVYCKLSGLLTEAGDDWVPADLAPYVTHLLAEFRSQRLIWGSDWPVLTVAASYGAWLDIAKFFVPDDQARDAVFGTNAANLYKLS